MLQAERDSGHAPLSPHIRRSRIFPQMQRIYDRMFRHQTLEWVATWARARGRTFAIHGQGWGQHPTLREFARGEVPSGRPLRALYQASAIGLQVNGYGSLHQRLLDGLASGACMICRYNPLDFVRRPFIALRDVIRSRKLSSLEQLLECAADDSDLARTIGEAERLGGACLQPITSTTRKDHVAMLKAGNPIVDLYTDKGLLNGLADGRFVGESAGGDLPGFDRICFRSQDELHVLLDELIADPAKRQSISAPMRDGVIGHHTFDGLVRRVLNKFGGRVVGNQS